MSKIAAQKAIAEHLKKVEEAEGPPALSRRVFEKYDTDESGTIDRNEFKAMCYDLGYYLSEPETDVAFRTIDLYFWRNDKRFENLQKNPAELQRLQAAVAYFQYFDQDKSGQLDKAEFAALHADLVKNNMTTHDLESCFAELDTDGSGTISFNEYVEWISCTRVPKVKVMSSD